MYLKPISAHIVLKMRVSTKDPPSPLICASRIHIDPSHNRPNERGEGGALYDGRSSAIDLQLQTETNNVPRTDERLRTTKQAVNEREIDP
jgi:hypothetical protein